MLRGEFHRADGLVLPNNVTTQGAKSILGRAFTSIAADAFAIGLCDVVYDPGLSDPTPYEPATLNGYARQPLPRSQVGWPTVDAVNGEAFIESAPVVFTATGVGFSKPITRMFLTSTDGLIWAISAALLAPLLILPATPINQRTFKYRLYLR